jgi:hypothetical protein
MDIAQEVTSLFNHMKFTNPRKVKKVLNKYALLKSYKYNEQLDSSLQELIPEIIKNKEDGHLLETAISLYLIILYEFDYELFEEVEDLEIKKKAFAKVIAVSKNKRIQDAIDTSNTYYNLENSALEKVSNFSDLTGVESISSERKKSLVKLGINHEQLESEAKITVRLFLMHFLPENIDFINFYSDNSKDVTKGFKHHRYSNGFFLFMDYYLQNYHIQNRIDIKEIPNFFKMVRTVL